MARQLVRAAGSTPYVAKSLAEALRNKSAPLVLDLANSEDLKCKNLLCEKVGEACICRLSHVLECLTEVRELSLAHNGLTSLPQSLWQLRSLQVLDLSHNRLTEIPDELLGLENLETLHLEGNRDLRVLPELLGRTRKIAAVRPTGT